MATQDDPDELGSMASVLEQLAAAPAELVVRGTVIDEQYRIERVLGHGAMGVVYLARDLRLERDVALKLARERSPRALARSSREALALAQLSHPNVVVIYQVGVVDERVYVAMEYVAGVTARAWCAEPHGVREIVQLYVAVGEGLAAAHAAGLVHRDFKPDNVLVGDDGRARVADFGLARASEEGPHEPISGTPAYMAPEQCRGEQVDHRADQFAFCSSLWEALYKSRPYVEQEPALRRAADAPSVPRHIELALRRGLAADREARWPSLAPLLDELRRDPARRRRVLALALGVPALSAIAIFAVMRVSQQPAIDACDGGPARIAAVWSPERAAHTRGAIAPAGAAAWIAGEATSVLARVDAWTDRWAAQYRTVCEATAWTQALHDRGMACLARTEHALDATLESLGEPGMEASKAEPILDRLPQPEPCVDPAYLQAIVAPPTDPALAQQVADAQRSLQRVHALAASGKFDRATEQLHAITGAPLEHPPLLAEVHLANALVSRWRGDDAVAFPALRDAYFEARTIGDRIVAADAAGEAMLALLNLSRDAEAGEWARLAEVEVASIPDPQLQARTFRALSIVATDRNEPARAVELADRSLKIQLRLADQFGVRSSLQARAAAYDKLGKYDLALADYDRAARLIREQSGETYPLLSAVEAGASIVLVHLGRLDDAVAAARRSLAIAEATSGPESDLVNNAVGALGVALTHAHQLPEALVMTDRSLAIDRKTTGERSYNVASDLNNRCELLTQMERFEDAIADGRAAIAIWSDTIGADANEVGIAELNLAGAFAGRARHADARAAADRAIAILGKQTDNPAQGLALIVRAVAAGQLHDPTAARRDLDASIAILTRGPGNPAWLAWARLELARLELAAGDGPRARELAVAARDGFRVSGDHRLGEAERLVAQLERTR